MRIGIIANNNLMYLPYLHKYIQLFEQRDVDYEIISWDRLLTEQPNDKEKYIFFRYYAPITNTRAKKIKDYFKYYLFVKKTLEHKKYEKLIILTSQTGVMLNGILSNKYNKRYIFDIRDFTYENIPIYRRIIERLVRKSAITMISSQAFIQWLPKSIDYILTHNINSKYLIQSVEKPESYFQGKKIIISFIGMIRYYEENIRLINAVANNPRFELRYAGKGFREKDLVYYCEHHNINNVIIQGEYADEDEKELLYTQTDMVNCLYGSEDTNSLTLIPNRLYESCLFCKPILVSKGSYLAQIIEQFKIGLVLDLKQENVPTRLEEYIQCFEPEEYYNNCLKFLAQVKIDERKFTQAIQEFCQ